MNELINETITDFELPNIEYYVPYQLCPKCNGQGIVSRPSWVPSDVDSWSDTCTSHLCDVCNGMKIIPMYKKV